MSTGKTRPGPCKFNEIENDPNLFSTFSDILTSLCKVFALPGVSTLKAMMKRVDINPGFHAAVLEGSRIKTISMSPPSKLCATVFDEMSIKEHVSYNVTSYRVDSLEDSYHQWWCIKKEGETRKANRLQLSHTVAGVTDPEPPNHSNSTAVLGHFLIVTPTHLRTSYNLFFLEGGCPGSWKRMVASLSSL